MATPEGKAACEDLELDPRVKQQVQVYERRLLEWERKGRIGSPPKNPTPEYSRKDARAAGHKKLVTAALLLGLEAVEPKSDVPLDGSAGELLD